LPDHKLQGVRGTADSPKATPKETKTLHFFLKERPAVLSFRGNNYFGNIDPLPKFGSCSGIPNGVGIFVATSKTL
jgi:hypothetical protein